MMNLTFLLKKRHFVNDFISIWGETFDLLKEFKNTPQDKEWHAEGDVHIHTDMVLEETYLIIENEAKHLSNENKIALILAALLHDISKPSTTKEREIFGKIRVVAPKHEEFGVNYLFYRLNNIVRDQKLFETVINLVGYHQVPKMLVIKDATQEKYFNLARKCSLELMYYLELADMRGRTCVDKEEQIEYLEFFKSYSEDYGLWNTEPYIKEKDFIFNELNNYSENTKMFVFKEFCRQFENKNIFTPEEEISRSFQYRDNYSHLALLCGVSGSGKSTLIEKEYSNHFLISLDNIREQHLGSRINHSQERKVLDIAKTILKEKLAKKEDVIWDATNYRRDFRKVPLTFGFNYSAFNEIILLNKTKSEIINQNKNRQNSVPDFVIDKQIEKFEVPNIEEAHLTNIIYS
jgi:predicted kinase